MIKEVTNLNEYCQEHGFTWNNNFKVQEFVSKKTYKMLGDSAIQLIDVKLLKIVFLLREKLDVTISINKWSFGGGFYFSGWRPMDAKIKGSNPKTSQHYKIPCQALDLKFKNMKPSQVQKFILDNSDEFMLLGLTRIEDTAVTKTWLHIDLKPTGLDHIKVFRP